jgi:hypothetical protein
MSVLSYFCTFDRATATLGGLLLRQARLVRERAVQGQHTPDILVELQCDTQMRGEGAFKQLEVLLYRIM